jgi:signal transduction histidine kinase
MIAGLAHESRNALQRIQSCSEMLELEVSDQPEPLRLVHRIQEAQDTLHRLFDDVRGYSAPMELELARCDVATSWREAWRSLEMLRRGRRATLRESVDDVDLHAVIDRFRMVQVFRNLLENSLAACPDPVEIVVTARAGEGDERPLLQLIVQDNGPGLTPAARETVFEPFFTTKTKGTGLGMAIAHRIVDAHGGVIEVGAQEGPGATFVITLPRDLA